MHLFTIFVYNNEYVNRSNWKKLCLICVATRFKFCCYPIKLIVKFIYRAKQKIYKVNMRIPLNNCFTRMPNLNKSNAWKGKSLCNSEFLWFYIACISSVILAINSWICVNFVAISGKSHLDNKKMLLIYLIFEVRLPHINKVKCQYLYYFK